MAKDIGSELVINEEEHPSITKINKNKKDIESLKFREIECNFVEKQIDRANVKKATGIDGISPKLLKLAKPAIAQPITNLINKILTTSKFPQNLKEAQVVPCYKKNNAIDKINYRPASIILYISIFFIKAIDVQLTELTIFSSPIFQLLGMAMVVKLHH